MGANTVHLCFVFAQIVFYFRVWVLSEGIACFGLLMRVLISSSWDLIAISTHALNRTNPNTLDELPAPHQKLGRYGAHEAVLNLSSCIVTLKRGCGTHQ